MYETCSAFRVYTNPTPPSLISICTFMSKTRGRLRARLGGNAYARPTSLGRRRLYSYYTYACITILLPSLLRYVYARTNNHIIIGVPSRERAACRPSFRRRRGFPIRSVMAADNACCARWKWNGEKRTFGNLINYTRTTRPKGCTAATI